MASAPMEFLSTGEGAVAGGEALYCAIIVWLSVMSWIIFTCAGQDGRGAGAGRRGGSRGAKLFVGASRLCDGTGPGCSGGYGLCGSCVD